MRLEAGFRSGVQGSRVGRQGAGEQYWASSAGFCGTCPLPSRAFQGNEEALAWNKSRQDKPSQGQGLAQWGASPAQGYLQQEVSSWLASLRKIGLSLELGSSSQVNYMSSLGQSEWRAQ